MRMHEDQIDVTAGAVARLVAAQFPRWGALPVRPVASSGTVNALFRLGDDIVLRFPLRPAADPAELAAEQEHARRVAAVAPVAVPRPLALGAPGAGYPGAWAVYRWLPGQTASPAGIGDPEVFAGDLAGFVKAVHGIAEPGPGRPGRGRRPLAEQDAWVRQSLAASRHLVDTVRLGRIWAGCRAAPAAPSPGVWVHTDLMPGNLLVRDGRLAAVIDLGPGVVGDPAVDLMPAWNLLAGPARETYRRALGADDATWERGRGWALVQAIGALWYYTDTNPVMAGTAARTLAAILD